jgi:RNA polymerase sigma factor (sigma-70 family)
MSTVAQLTLAVGRLCRGLKGTFLRDMPDSQLLDRFVLDRDEAAFSQLVERHGRMVLQLARRVLRDGHAAEDVFQATFLVLARKAGSVRQRDSVASWLYAVAYRLALRSRASFSRATAYPAGTAARREEVEAMSDLPAWELRTILDEELNRLPSRTRAAVVACYLEGKSRTEAARELSWRPRAVKHQLERGREILRQRLVRRGVTLSASLLSILAADSASAAVPNSLVNMTARAALQWASHGSAAGVVSAKVAALAEGMMRSMMMSKVKAVSVFVLTLCLIGTAASGLYRQAFADTELPPEKGNDPKAVAPAAPGQAAEKKDLHGDALPFGAEQRLGTVRFRHNSTAIAYSPDGKILASGGRDNVIRLFDAGSGKEIRRLVGHQKRSYNPAADPTKGAFDALVSATGDGGVNSVAFARDGKTLASGGWDDTIRLWDVETGKQLRKIDAHKAMVGRVLFSPDGKILASRGALDGTVRLWDPVTGTQLQKFVGLSNINPWRFNHDMALAISPDSKTVAATARNNLVFFDIASGAELKRVPAHIYGITLAYSPDGKLLASGGVDQGKDVYSLRIWDAATYKELRQCKLPKNEPPTYIAWDPNNNGKFAAVIAEDVMHIFDAGTGTEVIPLKHYWPSRVIYSTDGKTIASAGSGPTIRHWDAATGNELHLEFEGHRSGVNAVSTTADGKLIASGGENIRLWNPATGKVVRTIDVKGGVNCLAFAPDGKTIASGGNDRIVHLWDVETGKSLQEFKPHNNSVRGLAFSSDGKLLATGDSQSTIRIWDAKSGQKVQEIDNQSLTESLTLAFGPENKTILVAGAWNDSGFMIPKGATLKINGKEVKVPDKFTLNIQGVTIAPKEGNYVVEWDVTTGKEVRKFAGLKEHVRSLAYSPNGKLVAGASKDGKISIWDTESGKERLHFLAHPNHGGAAFLATPHLAFAPDSKTLASASTDQTIRLWDVTTAREIGQFEAPDSPFSSIVFSKDGKLLISGSTDTGVLVWKVDAAGKAPVKRKPATITFQ